jgi:TfoX-like protein
MGKGAKADPISAERLELFDRLIATQSDVARKGATVPYTSLNGHMFGFLSGTGTLALRLPSADRKTFIERYHAAIHEAYGTVMRDWVTVPDALFADTNELAPWFRASYAYVAAMTPKATRRKS